MAFCGKCGTQVEEGVKFCPACGNSLDSSAPAAGAVVEGVYDQNDIQNNKVMAIISYIWILSLVPLLAAKDSPFAQYHGRQGFTLFAISLVSGIVSFILNFIPVVGIIYGILNWILGIIIFVFCIIGIVNAVKGEAKPIPVTGKWDFWHMITKK